MALVLGKQLKKLLDKNGLNASRFAELSGISVQTVHNWLNGQSPRNIEQMKKVAEFFSVSIEYLCFDESKQVEVIDEYRDEINAGVFEVVLRPVRRK